MNQLVSSVVLAAMLNLFLWPLNVAEALLINDRVIEPSKETTESFLVTLKKVLKANPNGKLHGLATFPRYLSPNERKILAKFGVHVLEPYQDSTYWVSVSKPANLYALRPHKLVPDLIPLLDEDRVHPKIWKGSFDSFFVTLPGEKPFNYVLNDDGTLNLTIRLHVDVSNGQAKKLLSKYTENLTKKGRVTWIVVISQPALKALAKEDSVQWIEAGPLPFLPENDVTSSAIKVDLIRGTGMPPLNGSGVRIGIFDYGIDQDHPDFGNRVTPDNPGAPGAHSDGHGTAVAGTVAGSGLMSQQPNSFGCSQTGTPYQWIGMAPQALLIERPWSDGDFTAVHETLIASPQGMHLSNHSYTISDFDGEYSEKDRDRDAMIRGTTQQLTIPPRLSVFSAGNQGMSNEPHLYQKGYFSLTKQLKNGLVAGNWQAVEDNPPDPLNPSNRIYRTSSLGPTYDGRIKPDLVVPGRLIVSTDPPQTESGCTSYYLGGTGTSASAATVSGSIALLLQRYASLHTSIPLPSTIRAVMIHTATDIQSNTAWFCNSDGVTSNPCSVGGQGHASVWAKEGPDFVTGWGLIDAQAAVQIVNNNFSHEGSLPYTCARKTHAFPVTSSNPLRITLAWDDYPASPQIPNTNRKLVNDLDLILVDPNGTHHYPWRLNQTILDSSNLPITDPGLETCTSSVKVERHVDPTLSPSSQNDANVPSGGFPPAVQGATDHLNNVEVVDVPSPVLGTWQAKVTGFAVPWGPQTFSLVGANFVDISITTPTKCKIHGLLCTGLSNFIVCQQHPQVCRNIAYYGKPKPGTPPCPPMCEVPIGGTVRVRFDSYKDKSIIPVNKLCGLVFDCPPCIKKKTCERSFVRLDTAAGNPGVLDVEVFTAQGQLLKKHYAEWKDNQVDLTDNDLILTIKPTKLTNLRTDYEARMRISDSKIIP